MNRSLVMSAVLLAFVGASTAKAAVWQDTNTWNADWEQKYSSWIETSFNEDIFTSGKYKGIPTDCADAVYASRLIFAYENNLPFVIQDPTGGSSKITNRMTRFDGTSDSFSRMKKFLLYVADVTSTKSLPYDSYPVKISRDYVKAGV